jgi:hypothetical protein
VIKKIISFGDSYLNGNELANSTQSTWPALIAQKLGLEFVSYAIAGCGNRTISRRVLDHFYNNPDPEVLVVINWTWSCRWDFHIATVNKWRAFGPDWIPTNLIQQVGLEESQRIFKFYQDYPGNSELWNKTSTLESMYSTQIFLQEHGIKSVQTYMDDLVWDKKWHAPGHVQILQDYCRPNVVNFQDKNFLDWSQEQGFFITEKWKHPLDDAHQAACDFWLEHYQLLANSTRHV